MMYGVINKFIHGFNDLLLIDRLLGIGLISEQGYLCVPQNKNELNDRSVSHKDCFSVLRLSQIFSPIGGAKVKLAHVRTSTHISCMLSMVINY